MSIRNVSDKEPLNKEDGQQLRAILELQWRACQTGHNPELLLQSQLSKLTIATTGEPIKLVREVYNTRYVSLKYEDLEADKLEDFCMRLLVRHCSWGGYSKDSERSPQ